MRSSGTKTFLTLLSLAALIVYAVSTLGLLFDHHFVEHDPIHLHLGSDANVKHLEPYQLPHSHVQGHDEPSSVRSVAMKDFDGGLSEATVLIVSQVGIDSWTLPTSEGILTPLYEPFSSLASVYLPAPDHPPRFFST